MHSLDPRQTATVIALLTGVLLATTAMKPARAQQPAPATGTSQATPYRPPTIALVQPTGVTPVPRDKPIVVFRFRSGEIDDPIDARSFTVTADGVDRTVGFRVAADEAWGSLGGASPGDSMVAPGPHAVSARICSVRGLCATAEATVAVDAGTTTSTPSPSGEKPPTARARLIARVLDAVRRIFVP